MLNLPGGFYHGPAPTTGTRMACYAAEAQKQALDAIAAVKEKVELGGITHLVVASCPGFVAPGIAQIVARELGMPDVERTLVGFMGFYAAVAALRTPYHVVRSETGARGRVGTVEISSLPMQQTQQRASCRALLQF